MATSSRKIQAILSIIAGIVVIVNPDVLAWVVGLYLIIVGALDLMNK